MKHLKKLSENQQQLDFNQRQPVDESVLISCIDDIIGENLEIEDVPYALEDGLKQINYESRKRAAVAVVKYLKENNLI